MGCLRGRLAACGSCSRTILQRYGGAGGLAARPAGCRPGRWLLPPARTAPRRNCTTELDTAFMHAVDTSQAQSCSTYFSSTQAQVPSQCSACPPLLRRSTSACADSAARGLALCSLCATVPGMSPHLPPSCALISMGDAAASIGAAAHRAIWSPAAQPGPRPPPAPPAARPSSRHGPTPPEPCQPVVPVSLSSMGGRLVCS